MCRLPGWVLIARNGQQKSRVESLAAAYEVALRPSQKSGG
jgi:hypothetical protein